MNTNINQTIKILYQKKWLIFWLTVLGAVLFFAVCTRIKKN